MNKTYGTKSGGEIFCTRQQKEPVGDEMERESTKRLSNLSKEEIQNLIEQEDAESTQKGTQKCYCNSFGSLTL